MVVHRPSLDKIIFMSLFLKCCLVTCQPGRAIESRLNIHRNLSIQQQNLRNSLQGCFFFFYYLHDLHCDTTLRRKLIFFFDIKKINNFHLLVAFSEQKSVYLKIQRKQIRFIRLEIRFFLLQFLGYLFRIGLRL